MSEEDEMLSLGRLVSNASESKKRTILLKSNLEAVSRSLMDASGYISGYLSGMKYPDFDAVLSRIPTQAAVIGACAEYQNEKQKSEELAQKIKDLGI